MLQYKDFRVKLFFNFSLELSLIRIIPQCLAFIQLASMMNWCWVKGILLCPASRVTMLMCRGEQEKVTKDFNQLLVAQPKAPFRTLKWAMLTLGSLRQLYSLPTLCLLINWQLSQTMKNLDHDVLCKGNCSDLRTTPTITYFERWTEFNKSTFSTIYSQITANRQLYFNVTTCY